MILTWTILISIGAIAYIFFLATIIRGLICLRHKSPVLTDARPFVSVVVAARNEEKEIQETLNSLLNQNYPEDRLEIIIVDDRSVDKTADIVEKMANDEPRIRLLRQKEIHPDLSPKKQALELGLRSAKGEIIVTTDADCHHDTFWLETLASLMTPEVGMVTGQARFDIGNNPVLWQGLQALDFQSQGAASAGLITAGMPFNCTSASLAFRLALFDEVGGWSGVKRLISGDDELLLSKASRSRWKVVAAAGKAAVVQTRPPGNLHDLWNQRIRWGSKGLYYRPTRTLVLTGVFLFYLGLLLGPVAWVFGGPGLLWLGLALVKSILDWSVLMLGSKLFAERFNLAHFIILEIIHPLAIVAFVIAGHLSSFEWKDQVFRSRGAADR